MSAARLLLTVRERLVGSTNGPSYLAALIELRRREERRRASLQRDGRTAPRPQQPTAEASR